MARAGGVDVGLERNRLAAAQALVGGDDDVTVAILDPAAEGFSMVVSGHSHKPSVATRDGVLYVNPGSAGPRRFKLPVSVGMLVIEDARVEARLHTLTIG